MPCTTLAGQFVERHERTDRLMRGLLADAVETYLTGGAARDRAGRERWYAARDWIASRSRRDLLDFENVCDWLAIDADQVRMRLRADRRRAA